MDKPLLDRPLREVLLLAGSVGLAIFMFGGLVFVCGFVTLAVLGMLTALVETTTGVLIHPLITVPAAIVGWVWYLRR